MSNVAKQKKKAAEFEAKRQFDKALAVYIELLDNFDAHADELDVALFNRVGDMLLRQGNVADAVDYYEKAVDRYAESGFFNNAIALCNKILRQSPGRSIIYYKLGKISAQKGFKNDAKQNFLEYADRMQKSGRIDEAFRALKEFADLCPDQDDIRLMLADQLSRQDKKNEAVEQLQTLFDRYSSEGRDTEARATLDRIKTIDPTYEPRSTGQQRAQKGSDLVFLDVYEPSPSSTPSTSTPLPAGLADLAIEQAPEPSVEPAREQPETDAGETLGGFEATSFTPSEPAAAQDSGLLDFEPTSFSVTPGDVRAVPDAPSAGGLEGLEATSFEIPSFDPPPASEPAPALGQRPSAPTPIDGLDFLVPPEEVDVTVPETSLEFFMPGDETPTPREDAGAYGDAAPAAPREPDAPQGWSSGELLADMESPFLQRDDVAQIDLGGLDVFAGTIEPGTEASVAEVDPMFPDAEPLEGLPLMELEVPAAPVVDADQARRSLEIPELSLDEEALGEASADEEPHEPTPTLPMERVRRSTIAAEQSVELLAAAVESDPRDHALRRQLGEARLDSGDREGGLADLDMAMIGLERDEDLSGAASIADEIARITPESVRIHQKRVEYAFRTNERTRLVSAYLDLAGALLGDGQTDKARTVYQRVLDLSPDEIAAQAGLAALTAPARPTPAPDAIPPRPTPHAPSAPVAPPRPFTTPAAPSPAAAAPEPERPRTRPEPAVASGEGNFVNLGDWLREDAGPKSTRMVVDEQEPTGDEDADFADMLRKFKQGIDDNVDAEDHQSHYDLGVAFKEMGLIDEAIAEFQRALRAPSNRLPTYEALGQCFVEKGQYQVARAILTRALSEPHASDEQLIGVLYLLGAASEALAQHAEALGFYQRVFVVDIQFRDVAERLTAVEQASR